MVSAASWRRAAGGGPVSGADNARRSGADRFDVPAALTRRNVMPTRPQLRNVCHIKSGKKDYIVIQSNKRAHICNKRKILSCTKHQN